jgi:DNA gyrase inhibitor GyrI
MRVIVVDRVDQLHAEFQEEKGGIWDSIDYLDGETDDIESFYYAVFDDLMHRNCCEPDGAPIFLQARDGLLVPHPVSMVFP